MDEQIRVFAQAWAEAELNGDAEFLAPVLADNIFG
jgi:hypothetical protein